MVAHHLSTRQEPAYGTGSEYLRNGLAERPLDGKAVTTAWPHRVTTVDTKAI